MGDHRDEASARPSGAAEAGPHGDEELQRTLDAQRAHGGSMAPDLVDPTGEPRAEPPAPTGA